MSFGSAISYVLNNIGKIFGVFSGLSYLKTGGINQSINVVKANGTHFDMRNSQDTIYTGWSVGYWIAAIGAILNFILTAIFDDFTVGGLILTIVPLAISLCIVSFFITLGKKNESHWKGWLVKVLVICGMISIVGYVLSTLGTLFSSVFGLIGALIGGAAFGSVLGGIGIGAGLSVALEIILSCVVAVAINVMSALNMLTVLEGMNKAVATNGGQMGYNNQMNYNSNGFGETPVQNGYNPNNYNPNMNAGFGAVNMGQNNNSFDMNKNPSNQGVGSFGQNNFGQNNFGQNNFGQNQQQNDFTNNQNQQNFNQNMNPQNVQMYACPYCGKAVMQGANPCPHCNNSLNWG